MQAPEFITTEWFNADDTTKLADYRGKVVVVEAFQMLCPGCIQHGIPLAQKIQRMFPADQVAVLGLHCVFEHHAAMTPVSLNAFLQEFQVTFPIAVDAAGEGYVPQTMEAYQLRGTPSLLIIDQKGELQAHQLGQVSELQIGAEIATLIASDRSALGADASLEAASGCESGLCTV
ncbi:TlpA family protein disulfide reductase [Parasedimentitalea marina]|uniref:TlpA family protein disulfide reductase n=1 Tax=Parasedimentitalea marina TaxID=2483033 RepID=A0A3T0N3Q0_9RHOB|nr:TlpA disulfide reductase family protein [Parasedimentitalea marina]AZV78656.1 TlpA family protein disulfide reductase [Parasedimentitalea marina]